MVWYGDNGSRFLDTPMNSFGVAEFPTSVFHTPTNHPTSTGSVTPAGGCYNQNGEPIECPSETPIYTVSPVGTVDPGNCKPRAFGSVASLRANPIVEASLPEIDDTPLCYVLATEGDITIGGSWQGGCGCQRRRFI